VLSVQCSGVKKIFGFSGLSVRTHKKELEIMMENRKSKFDYDHIVNKIKEEAFRQLKPVFSRSRG
jgi:hypothetical protein